MATIRTEVTTDPQDLNNDGNTTQSEKNRYRKGERKAPGGGTTGGGGNTGTTGTTGATGPAVVKPKLPAGTTGRKIEDSDILWGTGEYGGVVSYKSKGAAENYLTKDAPEYATIKASYDAWGKSVYGSRTSLSGFWKKVVGAAQSTATTPWAVLASYNSQFPGGSLDGTDGPVGPTGPSSGPQFVGTSRADMDYFIDSTIQAAFNRPATQAEKDMFAKQYAAGEKLANKQARTGKGPGWSKDKYTKDFLTNSLRSSLGVEPDAQLLGDAGSIQDQLEQYASDMGLTKTLRGINNDVIRVMQGESINDVMRSYKDEAIILFKPLADKLKADNPTNLMQGLKVKDILTPYTSFIEDLTDKVRGSVKLTDSIVQKIISSDALPDMGTVNQWIRGTDDFAKSTTAKKEAQDLGVSFLKAFGWGNK